MTYIRVTPVQKMKEVANAIILVNENIKPTEEQIEECKQWADTGVSTGKLDEWYVLLRETQGNLNVYNEGLKYMIDGHDFIKNSLFCEWAYIINLDTERLEIYRGFNTTPNGKGRYANLSVRRRNNDYYGVTLFTEIPIISIQNMKSENIEQLCINLEEFEEVLEEEEEKEGNTNTKKKSAYEILGVDEKSSPDDIKEAFKKKAQLYHPDKVASLAPEFSVVAEKYMKDINNAYEELKRKF